MELIDIVDKEGNFTGEVIDKDIAHDKNLLHNEVGCLVINNKGQVLLQKRAASKRFNPNKYALCAGHVDSGESLENAMIRELEEEIGIKVSKEELHPYLEREITIRETNSHITYFYYVISNLKEEDFVIQEEELSGVKWFDIDEVIEMLKNRDERTAWGEERIPLFEGLKKLNI